MQREAHAHAESQARVLGSAFCVARRRDNPDRYVVVSEKFIGELGKHFRPNDWEIEETYQPEVTE
jgi:hypothetical protein